MGRTIISILVLVGVSFAGSGVVVQRQTHGNGERTATAGSDAGSSANASRSEAAGGAWIATLEAELIATYAGRSDFLGHASAISGDFIVLAATFDDTPGGINAGSVYVHVRSAGVWAEQAHLFASGGAAQDLFGAMVAIDADTIVVGAPGSDATGAAYVFVRTGALWTEQAKLTAGDAMPGDSFGWSVGVHDDTIVVGAPGDTHLAGSVGGGPSSEGSAYVFVRTGAAWSQQAKLTAVFPANGEGFGAVAISGDHAIVGAYANNDLGFRAGTAYVFNRIGTQWLFQAQIYGGNTGPGDYFGLQLALDGDTALVGAINSNQVGADEGAAYVFRRVSGIWSEEAMFSSAGVKAGGFFAGAVALDGDRAIVSSPTSTHAGVSNAGAVYVFQRSGTVWGGATKIGHPSPAPGDQFGSSVGASGTTVVVGAKTDEPTGSPKARNDGAGFVYELAVSAPVTYCTAGASASGCEALLSASGTASANSPSGFLMEAVDIEGGRDGLFFFGTNGRQANPWGNGTSLQCVVPPVRRAGLLVGSGTANNCDGSFSQDLNARWCPTCPNPNLNPGAGALVQAQLWYRDPLNTSSQTTSMSDAIEFYVGL